MWGVKEYWVGRARCENAEGSYHLGIFGKLCEASTSLSSDTYLQGHRHFNCDIKPHNPIFSVDNVVDTCALRNGLANTVSVILYLLEYSLRCSNK